MAGNRYDRGWMAGRGYGREFGRGPTPRRGRYDAGMQGRYDRGWTGGMAYGREPGMSMERPGTFTPFGWDPMMRWAGWDPLMGFVPYQDAPPEWSYGLADDYRRYEHDYFRGNSAAGYGRDHGRPRYDRDPRGAPPRQGRQYGRGAWDGRGYDGEHTPRRPAPRR